MIEILEQKNHIITNGKILFSHLKEIASKIDSMSFKEKTSYSGL